MPAQWRIERRGRAWQKDEAMRRWELTPDRLEMVEGRLLWDEQSRLALLGLLLENVGADAAVRLGEPAVWMEAVEALRAEQDFRPDDAAADPELPIGAGQLADEARVCAALLGRLMSDLSQDYWCAGWLIDIEFELWEGLAGGSTSITPSEIAQLLYLSERCGGWIVFDNQRPYRRYVRLADWSHEYEVWRAQRANE